MRRRKIMSLHRKYTTLSSPLVFIYCEQDPPDTLRDLDDIETLQAREAVEAKHGELFQFDGDFRAMSMPQIATMIRSIGKFIEYGAIRDPSDPHFGRRIQEPYVDFFRPQ